MNWITWLEEWFVYLLSWIKYVANIAEALHTGISAARAAWPGRPPARGIDKAIQPADQVSSVSE